MESKQSLQSRKRLFGEEELAHSINWNNEELCQLIDRRQKKDQRPGTGRRC